MSYSDESVPCARDPRSPSEQPVMAKEREFSPCSVSPAAVPTAAWTFSSSGGPDDCWACTSCALSGLAQTL